MHQIGVVGLSYRHAGVDEIARFAIPRTEVVSRLPELRQALGVSEVFYVGTCNRVEVVYATGDTEQAGDAREDVFRALTGRAASSGEATRILRAWTGEAAVEHMFLLACGLDSAQTGEQEIAAQIRGAWESAREAGTCGPVLNKLLSETLRMSHRLHQLESRVRTPSLGDLAAARVLAHVAPNRSAGPAPVAPNSSVALAHVGPNSSVALLGVSPMTRRCGAALHRAGIPLVIVNRTLQPARELAESLGGRGMSLEEFRAQPPRLGALVLAAGGSEPLLDSSALSHIAATARRPIILVDFGVPPNADIEGCRAAAITRVGMDELIRTAQEQRLAQLMRLAPVRAAIDERLTRLREELAARAIGRQLADLRTSFEQIAADEARRVLAADLRDLDQNQRELVERLAWTVARRLAHLPLAGLRAAAVHASTEAVEAFFREARLHRTGEGSNENVDRGRPG